MLHPPPWGKLVIGLGVLLVVLIGGVVDFVSPPVAPTQQGVQWQDYAASLRSRIDAAQLARDCNRLQAEYDMADANNVATMNRVGHSNAELMSYIDAAMRSAGCN